MIKRIITLTLMLALVMGLYSATPASAAVKKLKNGGYYVEYTSASIKNKTLTFKGHTSKWERSPKPANYDKTGTFKLKLAKKCTILDGYKKTETTISKVKFNALCKLKNELHTGFAFTVKKNKITMIRFW